MSDSDRCVELDPAVVDEVYTYIVNNSDVTLDMVSNFRASSAYLVNEDAWDWAMCLTRFGWRCSGGSGIGTLVPTPPTECESEPGDDASSVIVSNPLLDGQGHGGRRHRTKVR